MAKLVAIISFLALLNLASGFSTRQTFVEVSAALRQNSRVFLVNTDKGDFPPEEEEYTGDVDWDAEWKKVVASDGNLGGGRDRPGKDFYKSEAEIAAIKATNKAASQVRDASSSIADSVPDIRSLSGDWKFWIAILAVVSVGLSLLTAPPADMIPPSDGSYYI